ncbi:MAG: alpha/beta fold hydrolase [Anaerovoracaceae bacterium]
MIKRLKTFLVVLLSVVMILTITACGSSSKKETEEKEKKETWDTLVDVDWKEDYVKLDTGIKMCYLTMGPEDGTPLLLIHGATDSRLSWAQVAPILADDGFRVYIPELRGHGKTDKPKNKKGVWTVNQHVKDITNFMDKMDLGKTDIVGHSLGTFIAQGIAIHHPEKAKSITLIASGAKMKGNDTLEYCMNGDGKDYLGAKGYDKEGKLPDSFIKDWTACDNEDKDFSKAIYLHAKENLPYYAWAYIFGGLLTCDNTNSLDEIKCPVQIIWGTKDVVFLKKDQKELKAGLTNAKTVEYYEIKGASHNVHWDSKDNAEEVSDRIEKFVE